MFYYVKKITFTDIIFLYIDLHIFAVSNHIIVLSACIIFYVTNIYSSGFLNYLK